jgi:hypothetical protein
LRGEVDEDIASTEASESAQHEKDSFTIVSSDESKNDVEKYRAQEISSPSEDDNDVITAHVVIEQALHLPLVKSYQNMRFVIL